MEIGPGTLHRGACAVPASYHYAMPATHALWLHHALGLRYTMTVPCSMATTPYSEAGFSCLTWVCLFAVRGNCQRPSLKGDSAKAVAQLTAAEGIFALHGPKLDAATQTTLWNHLEVARRNNGIVQVRLVSVWRSTRARTISCNSCPSRAPHRAAQPYCIRLSSPPSHAN